MDIKKIIRKVLLEVDEQKSGETEYIMNWAGVSNLPKSFGGKPLLNIKTISVIPDINNYNVRWFETSCKEYLQSPNNKYPSLDACINAQKRALLDQMEVGGVSKFTWDGQEYKACVRRNDKLQYSTFSGYYGTTIEGGNCYAPEFYYTMTQKKYQPEKEGDGAGVTSDKSISLTGPDFK
jgi:hypothetical protein